MAAYKIPNTPARDSTVHELADYLEILCLVNDGNYSINDAHSQIDIISDEDDADGIMNEDDALFDGLQSALEECDRRSEACKGHYPFVTNRNGIVLEESKDPRVLRYRLVYIYLLLSTRLNMKKNKSVDGIDGTLLFERLSAIAVKNYFGPHASSLVFGTASEGGFQQKISKLIQSLGEGGNPKEPEDSTHDEKDGGLDVVVWIPFSDGKRGKLIGFGQCKTGTEWREQVGNLDPDEFCKTYFYTQPYSSPVKLFFVAESFKENSEKLNRKAGIMFDRCRIMEFLGDGNEIDSDLLNKIKFWVEGNMPVVTGAYSV